jgi:hypothetical protein
MVMVPPPHIGKKITHQLFRRLKAIRLLIGRRVSMIAFAALVVVAQHAATTDNISQPVLETVCRAFERPRELPNDDLREGVGSNDHTALDDLGRWHALKLVNADGPVKVFAGIANQLIGCTHEQVEIDRSHLSFSLSGLRGLVLLFASPSGQT